MEVNQFTFQILQNVISKLGLKEYDIDLVNVDATKFQIDSKKPPDIIISETMQNALAKEQQVSIYLNLMRQVTSDTVFIPEKIELHLGLKKAGIPSEELQKQHFNKVEKVFEVSKASMFPEKQPERQIIAKNSFAKRKTVIESKMLKDLINLSLLLKYKFTKTRKLLSMKVD